MAGHDRTILEWRSSKPAAFGLSGRVDRQQPWHTSFLVHIDLMPAGPDTQCCDPLSRLTGPCVLRIMSHDGKEKKSPTLMSSIAQELPWDVLQEIFTQALFPALRERRTTQTEQTMRLCQICSHWRTVILGSSAIWQYIECEVTYRLSDNLEILPKRDGFNFLAGPARIANIDLLKWWLKNLGSYVGPHIEVFTNYKRVESGYDSSTFDDDHAPFFHQLLSSARSLHVGFDFSSDLDVWLKSREDVFMNLEEIYIGPMPVRGLRDWSLRDWWRRDREILAVPIRIFNQKSIRGITFASRRDIIWNPASDIEYQPPWNLLTQLQIEELNIGVREWATFIRELTALQYGCFTVHFKDWGWVPTDLPMVCLPHLLELKVGWPRYTNPVVNPLQNLKLPTLKQLHLLVPEPITTAFINQILCSAPRLLGLIIHSQDSQFPYSGGESENVEPLWGYAPMLEELILTYTARDQNADWSLDPEEIHKLWIEKLLASRWLDLQKPGKSFQLLKVHQEASDTEMAYPILQAVIDEYMKVQQRSYSICLEEIWRFSDLNDFTFAYWPHD